MDVAFNVKIKPKKKKLEIEFENPKKVNVFGRKS